MKLLGSETYVLAALVNNGKVYFKVMVSHLHTHQQHVIDKILLDPCQNLRLFFCSGGCVLRFHLNVYFHFCSY